MTNTTRWVITERRQLEQHRQVEMCEHKGIGHPDSLCDGIVEALALALNKAYLQAYGRIQHYNVDKALLIGGNSSPRFGGGHVVTPMRLIVCGRAFPLPDGNLDMLVEATAREYLSTHLRCDPTHFQIESAVRTGSPNLQQAFARAEAHPLANDTSFGVGFSPCSGLENQVLQLAALLRSSTFHELFPAAGDDFKVMGSRIDDTRMFTVALAIVDRHIQGVREYFSLKKAIVDYMQEALNTPCVIMMNTLDDPNAGSEDGIYLTVTGLSAEQGDDGQVGRGNRMNGLITPCRSMSLEAAAGKNPVAHVGKLYNALASEMANAIVADITEVREATVQLLSQIGMPVDQPALVSIELGCNGALTDATRRAVQSLAQALLSDIGATSARLIRGATPVF